MQANSIEAYFDSSLGGKTPIHFENVTKHIHTANVYKALATMFCTVTQYNFELLLWSFLHVNILTPRILGFFLYFCIICLSLIYRMWKRRNFRMFTACYFSLQMNNVLISEHTYYIHEKFGMLLQVVRTVTRIPTSWTHCNCRHVCVQSVGVTADISSSELPSMGLHLSNMYYVMRVIWNIQSTLT